MKRTLSLLMAFALVVTMFTGLAVTRAADVSFTDVPTTHWAYPYISYLSKKDVLVGDGNGKFRPEDTVTRAEFIKMIDEIFGLKRTVETNFTNVPTWAQPYVARAKAQGFLLDYASGDDFSAGLTREEAVALIMRYLALDSSASFQPSLFSDYYSIDVNYRDYVVLAVNDGIISGYKDGTFRPKNILTRAEALTILYKAAGAIYDQGAYSDSAGAYKTNAAIKSTASLYNLHLDGRIIIGEDVQTVNFIDCVVTGKIYVRGETTVTLKGTSIPNIVFLAEGGELTLTGKSVVRNADIQNTSYIEIEEGCKIESLTVGQNAGATKADGKGAIEKIYVYAPGVDTGKILPGYYEIGKGLTATFAGTIFKEGSGKPVNSSFSSAYVSGFTYSGRYSSGSKGDGYNAIYLTFTPNSDGYVYAAVWKNTESALSAREILGASDSSYGTYMWVKAGSTYDLTFVVPDDYETYNAGILLLINAGKPSATVVDVLYNQSAISAVPSRMGLNPPSAIKAVAPKWSASVTTDGKAIGIVFDQLIYTYNKRSQLVKLSDLTNTELSAIFGLEVVPGKNGTDPDFSVEVYEGPVTIVYLTPKNGIDRGEYYYVFLLKNLFNSQGTLVDSYSQFIYVR